VHRLPSATTALFAASVGGVAAGAFARLAGAEALGRSLWLATTVMGIATAAWWVLEAARARRLGVDLLALVALVGTVMVREELAGALVTLMLATGRSLESRAAARASKDLSALVARMPRVARVHYEGTLVDRAVEDLRPGDLVAIDPGGVIPVDGFVEGVAATIDESALTGEALPRVLAPGEAVRSGAVNAGAAFDLRATTTAAQGTYAGIVRLVEAAGSSTSPSERLADRYGVAFVLVGLAGAALAGLVTGGLSRAVAVLVVATPCPLVLAVPVALVSGLALCARRGVIVKGGAVLERLARGGTLLLDKTGTLTAGRPSLKATLVRAAGDETELLRLAAALEQRSPHLLAAPLVRAARERGLDLPLPTEVEEAPGAGIRGRVGDRLVSVGSVSFVHASLGDPFVRAARRRAELDGALIVFVAIDHHLAGALVLEDPIRPDAARTVRSLRRDGFGRVVMVTGDRQDVAEAVGAIIGVDAVLAERAPDEKVDAVRLEQRRGPTVMVGDGLNDAPALALADVGVALGARGASASSEAADVVLGVDRLESLGEAVRIARRSRRVALESAVAGIGLSLVAMVVAGLGLLPAAGGALAQEAIDVVAIASAMRALAPLKRRRIAPTDRALLSRFSLEREPLEEVLVRLRSAGDRLAGDASPGALAEAFEVGRLLAEVVKPLQAAEEAELYPVVERLVGGADPVGALLAAHAEIRHDALRIERLLDEIDPDAPDPGDLRELGRLLYDLHAVLRLHLAQEGEGYLPLLEAADGAGSRSTR
jgi:heavy metal translocating P-type ATPase